MLGSEEPGTEQVFETAALAIEGNTPKSNSYLGSVGWGWRIDPDGKRQKLPFAVISTGVPSAGFMGAAKQWNRWETPGVIKTASEPTKVYPEFDARKADYSLPKDTPVRIRKDKLGWHEVDVLTGAAKTHHGDIKWIRIEDLYDAGGGMARKTIPLPVEPKIRSDIGAVELRSKASSDAPVIATLNDTVRFKVLSSVSFGTIGSKYVEIELSGQQAGVKMMKADPFGSRLSIRGFIPRDSFE